MNDKIFISDFLEVKESTIPNAGFGVFTTSDIPALTPIEQCRVKLLYLSTLSGPALSDTWLASYAFSWTHEVCAIPFGFGCLYNHSTKDYNLDYKCISDPQSIMYMTVRDISAGEELFVRYFAEGQEWYEGNWIEKSPEQKWKDAEDLYLESLEPDHRLIRQPSPRIQARRKNRIGNMKTLSSIYKKS